VEIVRANVVEAAQASQRVATAIGQAQDSAGRIEQLFRLSTLNSQPSTSRELGSLVTDLKFRLGQAKEENEQLAARLVSAETGVIDATAQLTALDSQVLAQTDALNTAADRANTLLTENAKLTAERDRWRHMVMHWRVIAAVLTAALLFWIFKGPLFFALRKLVGIPI
jgi:hypothetical protein